VRCRWGAIRRSGAANGLYAEQLSGSPFTAPRGSNERSCTMHPASVKHSAARQSMPAVADRAVFRAELRSTIALGPAPIPKRTDFPARRADHETRERQHRQAGRPLISHKSMVDQLSTNRRRDDVVAAAICVSSPSSGRIDAGPRNRGDSRGAKFASRFFRSGARLYLRELRRRFTLRSAARSAPLSRQCARFPHPVAAYEDKDTPTECSEWGGALFVTRLPHSPVDVAVARQYAPTNTICGPLAGRRDCSIIPIRRSSRCDVASDTAGTANIDFVIFRSAGRWRKTPSVRQYHITSCRFMV